MDKVNEIIRLSASDLVNHLACRHLTELNHEVAVGLRVAPSSLSEKQCSKRKSSSTKSVITITVL